MGLIDDLGPGPVALDTVIFIYFIEANARYLPLLDPVFEAIEAGRIQAVTSALTLMETLVVPLRSGDLALAQRYEAILSHSRHLRLVDIDRGVLSGAAQLRAATRIKTPDALQVATALAHGCSAFLTNDRRIPDLPGLRVVELDRRRRR